MPPCPSGLSPPDNRYINTAPITKRANKKIMIVYPGPPPGPPPELGGGGDPPEELLEGSHPGLSDFL